MSIILKTETLRAKILPLGFLNESTLKDLIELDRLAPVLIRCGGCRLQAPAQDIEHIIKMVEKSGLDYIRDISTHWGR